MDNRQLSQRELHKHRSQLKLYQRLLPLLELKQRQLGAELQQARAQSEKLAADIAAMNDNAGRQLPMLASEAMVPDDLVSIAYVSIATDYIAGVSVATFKNIEFRVADYSRLATPVWIDSLVKRLKHISALQIQKIVSEQRVNVLKKAYLTIAQRVNLFEQVLIPYTRSAIKRILSCCDGPQCDSGVPLKPAKQKTIIPVH